MKLKIKILAINKKFKNNKNIKFQPSQKMPLKKLKFLKKSNNQLKNNLDMQSIKQNKKAQIFYKQVWIF